MNCEIDPDVKAVAEFMQRTFAVSKLSSIAEGVAAIAPLLWGHYGGEPVRVVELRECSPVTSGRSHGQHKQPSAT